jgi:hypothetical protein
MSHNSTANVLAVDVTPVPFSMDVDSKAFPHAAIRLKYHDIPRFYVENDCFPAILNSALSDGDSSLNVKCITVAVKRFFLTEQSSYTHLAITDSYPIATETLTQLWDKVVTPLGYSVSKSNLLEDTKGVTYTLINDSKENRRITFLRPSVILTFANSERIIKAGIDTLIGVTGLPIFSYQDLNSFLYRNNASKAVDELVLISGSSKDYEFRQGIDLLDTLLTFCSQRSLSADEKFKLLKPCYAAELSFLKGNDFQVLAELFSQPINIETLNNFKDSQGEIATSVGLNSTDTATWKDLLADYISIKISRSIDIRKDIRPDIGTIYHLVVNGQPKRVVMLADGFVVNFYAKHEKGVKTEFIDPVITMQLLSLVRISDGGATIDKGLHKMETVLKASDIEVLWQAIDDCCRPLDLS